MPLHRSPGNETSTKVYSSKTPRKSNFTSANIRDTPLATRTNTQDDITMSQQLNRITTRSKPRTSRHSSTSRSSSHSTAAPLRSTTSRHNLSSSAARTLVNTNQAPDTSRLKEIFISLESLKQVINGTAVRNDESIPADALGLLDLITYLSDTNRQHVSTMIEPLVVQHDSDVHQLREQVNTLSDRYDTAFVERTVSGICDFIQMPGDDDANDPIKALEERMTKKFHETQESVNNDAMEEVVDRLKSLESQLEQKDARIAQLESNLVKSNERIGVVENENKSLLDSVIAVQQGQRELSQQGYTKSPAEAPAIIDPALMIKTLEESNAEQVRQATASIDQALSDIAAVTQDVETLIHCLYNQQDKSSKRHEEHITSKISSLVDTARAKLESLHTDVDKDIKTKTEVYSTVAKTVAAETTNSCLDSFQVRIETVERGMKAGKKKIDKCRGYCIDVAKDMIGMTNALTEHVPSYQSKLEQIHSGQEEYRKELESIDE